MNEEIKKNEINEKELENVSGGASGTFAPRECPVCGGTMMALVRPGPRGVVLQSYTCSACGRREE